MGKPQRAAFFGQTCAMTTDAQLICSVQSPIGTIQAHGTSDSISQLEILPDASGARQDFVAPTKLARQLAKELGQYFAGKRAGFSVQLTTAGTEFQRQVWAELAKLKFGEYASYQQIAEAVGRPKGARAVGAAVGANPVPLLIGCHRILGSKRQMTGYSGGAGVSTKAWLLNHEGISFS
jgi:methylated-DNA-[protein]-cysteine S-methyltransferase